MTVQSLARNMTQNELAHWIAFFKLQDETQGGNVKVTVQPEKSTDDTMVDILMAHARG